MEQRIWKQVTVRVPPAIEDPVADFLAILTGRGVRIREEQGQSLIDAFLEPGDSEDHLLRIRNHLNDLVDMGLVEKSELDKRTNQYELTEKGHDAVLDRLDWMLSKFVTDETRGGEVSELIDERL